MLCTKSLSVYLYSCRLSIFLSLLCSDYKAVVSVALSPQDRACKVTAALLYLMLCVTSAVKPLFQCFLTPSGSTSFIHQHTAATTASLPLAVESQRAFIRGRICVKVNKHDVENLHVPPFIFKHLICMGDFRVTA